MALQDGEQLRYPSELPSWTFKDIRDQIPARLHEKNTLKAMAYAARCVILAVVFFAFAANIDSITLSKPVQNVLGPRLGAVLTCGCWLIYWWFQGLAFTGFWVMGHEAGHGGLSDNKFLSDLVGYILHTSLLTPYFSWRVSHHRHHSNHASMERDETYVPKTRSDLGIPADATPNEVEHLFEDTPLYTLFMLIKQQIFAFDAYLLYNVSGQMRYPKWTNHFNPNAIIFNEGHFWGVVLSDIGVIVATALVVHAVRLYGIVNVLMFYGVPWVIVHHWIVMITYLHHTDPILPHFRDGVWNFQRGASATIDRDFLGWQGRFFLYDVAHFHVVHHFFPRMPWYHGEEATKYLREALGPYYLHTSKPIFRTLWDNYNFCQFVDDEGEVVYYRNREGRTIHDFETPPVLS